MIPLALTGTQNDNVYGSLRRLRRPSISLTVGEPVMLAGGEVGRAALEADTERIMHSLASLLPEEYRGAYR